MNPAETFIREELAEEQESRRLRCLQAYQQHASFDEPAYSELVNLAAQICGTPIAFISFLDEQYQWFKASEGLNLTHTERQHAFCDHVVRQNAYLEVSDASQDPRFAANPLVQGLPHIRFYAGMPIRSAEGEVLGALAVVDMEARELDSLQRNTLKVLAAQVESLLQLRIRNRELDEARQRAERAEQSKSRFFAQISHELRTPLNGILGMLQVMGNEPLSKELEELSETIRFSAEQLLRLVNDLLDLHKLDAGKLHIEQRPFELQDLLQPLARTYSWQAGQKGIDFQLNAPASLPPLRGDTHRLSQVLMNLLSNAFKFTRTGSVSVDVKAEESAKSVQLHFNISDTGIGIPADVQERIFQDYVQASETTARRYGGTGLGLAITRELLRLMGSEISLSSEAGKGSSFRFSLNLPVCREAEGRLNIAREQLAADKQIKYAGKVLVVDDNSVNLLVMRKLLQYDGLLVDTAEDGPQALEYARLRQGYDLIFMDLQMPGMNGFDASRAIRALAAYEQVPIYALTASLASHEYRELEESGMQGLLEKPIRTERLHQVLAAHLPIADGEPALQLTQALKELAEVDRSFQQELVRTAEADFQTMLDELGGGKGSDPDFIRRLRHKYKATFQLFSLHSLDEALANLQAALDAGQAAHSHVHLLKKQVQEIGQQALDGLSSFD